MLSRGPDRGVRSWGCPEEDLNPGDPEIPWVWLPWLLVQIGIALTPCP